mmetsp:Transcript_8167/g.24466  ORF Transcript_8167/g.24466 Transcript_8167/m.24466 type:complete len:366 (-) Transcript_8167:26-1123(-)
MGMLWAALFAALPLARGFVAAPNNAQRCATTLRAAPTAPPRVVVDLDVVADTLPLESEVYLAALQKLRPEGPWASAKDIPVHRWRTFDLAHKFRRVLREKRVVRPADATMMLRLLFEEDEVGRRAIAAREDPTGTKWEGGGWAPTEGPLAGVRPGTRPLTAGEVVENWDEVLSFRCFAKWREEDPDFSLEDIDEAVTAAAFKRLRAEGSVADALGWRPDALRALRAAQEQQSCDSVLVLVRADLLGLGGESGSVLAGWRAVVQSVLPGADCAFARGALDVADELIDGSADQTLYYGGSPSLVLQLGAALSEEVRDRATGLHLCHWVERWRPAGDVPAMPFGVIALDDDHRDFRRALGVRLRPTDR